MEQVLLRCKVRGRQERQAELARPNLRARAVGQLRAALFVGCPICAPAVWELKRGIWEIRRGTRGVVLLEFRGTGFYFGACVYCLEDIMGPM